MTAYTQYDFIAPAPVRHEVSDEAAMVAEARLRRALQLNKGLKQPRHGVSRDDAETLLKWIVENDRLSYHENYPEKTLTLKDVGSYCGRSASLCYLPLEPILPEDRLNIFNAAGFFGTTAGTHEAVAVKLPVSEGGRVTDKVFLLDNSYGQFFWPEFNTPPRQHFAEGYFVTKTQQGRAFAGQLIRDGFIEMTPENAAIYIQGFEDFKKQSEPDIVRRDFVRRDPVGAFMDPRLSTFRLRPGKPVDWLPEEIRGRETLRDVALATPLTVYMKLHENRVPRDVHAKAFAHPHTGGPNLVP